MRISVLAVLVVALSSSVYAQSIPKGLLAEVEMAQGREVEIKNPNGLFERQQMTTGRRYNFDEKCNILRDGRLTVVGEKGDQVLVRYARAVAPYFGRTTECPNGALSWFPKDEFVNLKSTARKGYSVKQELEMREIERITQVATSK